MSGDVRRMLGEPVPCLWNEEDRMFARSRIAAAGYRVIPLVHEGEHADAGLLVVKGESLNVSFVVLKWVCGSVTVDEPSPHFLPGDSYYDVVFRGEGPSGLLRELRHTWWGEEGYLFYPPGKVITAAFEALKEWFDV